MHDLTIGFLKLKERKHLIIKIVIIIIIIIL